MKKTLLVMLVTLTLVLLASCAQEPVITEPPVTEPPVTEAPFDYKTLKGRRVEEWKDIGLLWAGTDKVLYLEVPSDWEIEKMNNSTYLIYCDGAGIGKITTQPDDVLFDILESEDVYKKGDLEIEYDVRCVHEEWGDDYRRVFGFWSVGTEILSMYLDIDYTAISDLNLARIYESVGYGDKNGGELFLDMDKYNRSNKILIIGNSFVGDKFSAISITLDQLLKTAGKTEYEFENITIYNMSIKDYIKEPYISDMRNGKYKVVFMCGIYGQGDVDGMQKAIDACRQSNTGLVFFLAHNERDERIAEAQKRYPDEMYLDWREEIDSFIDNNSDFWEFCMNDGPQHSTPLGGYVGAHMIYKAVFHEVPPPYKSTSLLSREKIVKMLGEEYINTGVREGELSYPVYELK